MDSMNKEVSFSSIERVFLTLAIDCCVDKITTIMWELDPEIPHEKDMLDYLEELRYNVDILKGKINE